MTTLNRVVLEWAGGPVKGRAVTVLHYSASDNAAPPVAAIRTAFAAASALFPNQVTISFPASGDKIIDTNGNLDGIWTASASSPVTGTGGTTSAAGVGACIAWLTGGIVSGVKGPRKLRGRTFLVPFATSNFDTNGTLQDGAVGVADALAGAIMQAGPLAIWHRPTSAAAANGNSYGVIGHRVNDKVAYLSSRRD